MADFDPAKEAINLAKHGISLARWVDLDVLAIISDDRFEYGEPRYRAYGLIEGVANHCLAAGRQPSLRAGADERPNGMSARAQGTDGAAPDVAGATGDEHVSCRCAPRSVCQPSIRVHPRHPRPVRQPSIRVHRVIRGQRLPNGFAGTVLRYA